MLRKKVSRTANTWHLQNSSSLGRNRGQSATHQIGRDAYILEDVGSQQEAYVIQVGIEGRGDAAERQVHDLRYGREVVLRAALPTKLQMHGDVQIRNAESPISP